MIRKYLITGKLNARTIVFSTLLLFILKFIIAFVFSQMYFTTYPDRKLGTISIASGDHYSYVGAMENYIQTGNYYFINKSGDSIRAGRAPYYCIPYWVARHFVSPASSNDVLTIINIVFDVFAIICLAIMAYSLAGYRMFVYYLGLALGGISTYVSSWSLSTVADGLAAPTFMIGIFFLWKAFEAPKNNWKLLLFTSLFFSWTIALRPYLSIIVAFFAFYYLLKKKALVTEIFKLFAVCVLPLVMLLAPWTIRNYSLFHRIIPFQQDEYAGYNYSPSELQCRQLMASLGEDGAVYWDYKSMASFFHPDTYEKSSYKYPQYLIKDTLFINEIEDIRHSFIDKYNNRTSNEETELVVRIKKFSNLYKAKYPGRYFLVNNVKKVQKFWAGHSGSYNLPVSTSGVGKILATINKVVQSILYYLVLIFGTFGLWRLRKYDKTGYILLAPIIILTLIFPLYFKVFEPRYSLPFYYPSIIGLCLFLYTIFRRLPFYKEKN